jgi:hypothetical protein
MVDLPVIIGNSREIKVLYTDHYRIYLRVTDTLDMRAIQTWLSRDNLDDLIVSLMYARKVVYDDETDQKP